MLGFPETWIIPGELYEAVLHLLVYLLKQHNLFQLFRRMLWHCFVVIYFLDDKT